MSSSTTIRALCAALSLIGLAACSGSSTPVAPQFAPQCPVTRILSDGADISRFNGAGTDITDMVLEGRMTKLGGKCQLDDPSHLRTELSVGLDLHRGPAARGPVQDVLYFVSISRGQTILDKQVFRLPVTFAGNTDRVQLTTDPVDLVVPITNHDDGANFSILVSFQLSPAELDFNRARGAR